MPTTSFRILHSTIVFILLVPLCLTEKTSHAQAIDPVYTFLFDGTTHGQHVDAQGLDTGDSAAFVKGLVHQALHLGPESAQSFLSIDVGEPLFSSTSDFTVQFWIRTVAEADRRFMVLRQKEVTDNSLASQKQPGWSFYFSGGTWAWSMGSGTRRITYERDNGEHMPLNDGRWHQLTMTYSQAASEVRLFYDGVNKVTYHVRDSAGFDFSTAAPMVVGWSEAEKDQMSIVLPKIEKGAEHLQALVDRFNDLGLRPVGSEEFPDLISDPQGLFDRKIEAVADQLGAERASFMAKMDSLDFSPVKEIESLLMRSPYTIHQALTFMEVAPLLQIYSLIDGKVTISQEAVVHYSELEQLHAPNFDIDNLTVWQRTVTHEEVLESYSRHFKSTLPVPLQERSSITAGAWNIFHGGKHFNTKDHGWDSRIAIAEIIQDNEVDIVMMQETYSSGDFIAAELGYYFATTVDWDYLNQGANISVLSRYPIEELVVPQEAPFMNVGAKISISDTQDMYAMSNWYGMAQFPAVFDFHTSRFDNTESIPVLFAGDFNAVPESDGGENLAARMLLENGFIEGFRDLHPDVEQFPGFTHRSGVRIDQFYYKGAGLNNRSTELVSQWPTGFPSDHYLIVSTFDLNYTTDK
ncbi:MAG: hypothetical protein HOC28_09240 [Bacteroidetes Order II. Incertae sedis bacterium]|jgi:hypothetical protein|nr:hypothetical protein [Bacteroidetes Order II. bacterium]MBT4603309.1 hypothetical protein [Bacteroidetes Order II. bacterium]MBT5250093.1 hypothetical protein [Bacteroidetes Order II. bacterium]MBT6201820.1 hypothetical protein [Bacteroidetes Order II. bacterium]MBT6424265.1 hypothetical protein [Bacteroidetes Order II. bacterium]